MERFFFTGYIFAGPIICMAVAGAAITHWIGLSPLLSYPLALILGFVPVVGSVLTFLGATSVWHLAWYWALLLACVVGPHLQAAALSWVGLLFALVNDALFIRRTNVGVAQPRSENQGQPAIPPAPRPRATAPPSAQERAIAELEEFLGRLREATPSAVELIAVQAGDLAHRLFADSGSKIDLRTPQEAIALRSSLLRELEESVPKLQRLGRQAEAPGTIVWLHTLRALQMPELMIPAIEMWQLIYAAMHNIAKGRDTRGINGRHDFLTLPPVGFMARRDMGASQGF